MRVNRKVRLSEPGGRPNTASGPPSAAAAQRRRGGRQRAQGTAARYTAPIARPRAPVRPALSRCLDHVWARQSTACSRKSSPRRTGWDVRQPARGSHKPDLLAGRHVVIAAGRLPAAERLATTRPPRGHAKPFLPPQHHGRLPVGWRACAAECPRSHAVDADKPRVMDTVGPVTNGAEDTSGGVAPSTPGEGS